MASCSTTSTAANGSAQNPFVLTKGLTFTVITRVNRADGLGAFDLTGYTGRAQMRKLVSDIGTPVATFTVTNSATVTGRADAVIGATESPAIPTGTYVFDIEFENDLDADDVIFGGRGYITVIDGVTK
jgi:hypothetical protein